MDTDLQLRSLIGKAQGSTNSKLHELQARGQQHYRAHAYRDALRCFRKAIELNTPATISLLDNRAATYIKLNQLDAALNDGRKMIQQEKTACMGYLRVGQILQLCNNQQMALEIYEMGLRKLPITSSQFEKLQGAYTKLKMQLVQVSPLEMLPLEIVEMIMKFLQFHEIVKLTRVSKSWHKILVSMPKLWIDLDFVGARDPTRKESIKTYIKRANGNVTRVALDKFGSTIEGVVRYITSTCRALQELRINGGYISSSLLEGPACSTTLKKLYVSSQCPIALGTVSNIFCKCPNLETVEVHLTTSVTLRPGDGIPWTSSLPNLHSLILGAEAGSHNIGRRLDLADLLATIPNVRNLTLTNWLINRNRNDPRAPPNFAALDNLESLDISGLDMNGYPLKLPSTIHFLNMGKALILSRLITWRASRLVRLSISHILDLDFYQLQAILEPNKGNLTSLDVSGCFLNRRQYLFFVEKGYLTKVEELKLQGYYVNDEVAIAISKNLPALKRLSLASTAVTGVGVKAIVTALEGKLSYLNLDNCHSTAYDAVEWARSTGVSVAFGFPDSSRGGKKTREQ